MPAVTPAALVACSWRALLCGILLGTACTLVLRRLGGSAPGWEWAHGVCRDAEGSSRERLTE